MTWGRRGAAIGLSVASILLCVALYAEIAACLAVPPRFRQRREWHLGPPASRGCGGSIGSSSGVAEIDTARPLFSPTRRPVETTVSKFRA